ncbi:MAG: hypothetical protein KME14_09690 [Tildeniella torsiva UHER 1998/13D]|jgi:hypothetical protein|nr:hypothetical protein [Tildeniella torsiva UHER 1998/13D]
MQTPALDRFLKQVGKVVHHLNTTVVGLSAVEAGTATKPIKLDISWQPSNVIASSRQARAFIMQATLVTVAEELVAYVVDLAFSPACSGLTFSSDANRANKFKALREYCHLEENHLSLGPLLVIHWRNKIIHRKSQAGLTKGQREILISESDVVKNNYKNLDPVLLLQHFDVNTPTLKDVSSLVAITINFVKIVDRSLPEPASKSEVLEWLEYLDLTTNLERVERVSRAKGKLDQGITNFLMTHCPYLKDSYFQYVYDES